MVRYLCIAWMFVFLNIFIFSSAKGQATDSSKINDENQANKVTGKVVDATDNQSIPFSTIVVKGTTTGASADVNGNFTVDAPVGSTLIVSYIGYITQNVKVTSNNMVIRLLKNSNDLNQVVVIGYGTQRKNDITTAVSSISGNDLARQPVANVAEAAQGLAAGVQVIDNGTPGSSPTILVRGTGSMIGGTHVLYVVDGILTDDISNLNPADILSFDVLKDASATAIYGSRGANGVVIITTRKGQSGKMKITYDATVGERTATDVIKMANAQQYENYYAAASGNILPASSTSTDWYKEILRTAWQQNHSLSLSGGNKDVTYLLSLSYIDQNGIVLNSDFKRYTLRSNVDYKVNKYVKVGLDASFSYLNTQEANTSSALLDAYRAAPIIPGEVNGKYGNTSSFQNVGNPLLDLNDIDHRIQNYRTQASGYIEVNPINGLTFRSAISGDLLMTNDRSYNYRFESNDSTFITAGGNQRNPYSSLAITDVTTFHWSWDNLVTYKHAFGRHLFTLLGGTSTEEYTYNSIYAYRQSVPADPSLWYIDQGDANTSQNNGSGDWWARQSFFGRLNYSYDDKYLFAATIRDDGSSRLPAQNRYQIYPSLSAGWVISKEDFMKQQHIVDYLKLRAGWGKVGNDQLPTNSYTYSFTYNQAYPFSAGQATNGAQNQNVKDENLNWETTEEYDAGLDFTLLNQRLTGEVDYYNKKVLNLLDNVLVLATVGDIDQTVYQNIGTVSNKGWEFTLNWSDKIGRDWSYHIGGNVTFNKNEVLSLNGGEAVLDGGIGSQEYVTRTDNGEPIGSYYVLKVIGIFQNQAQIDNYKNAAGQMIQPNAKPGDLMYADTNGDGKIDDNDRVYAGSYQPKVYYGINLGITYKNFDLTVNLYGNAGNQIYNGNRASRQLLTDNIEASQAYNRWTPGNTTTTEPAANGGVLPASTYFIESGSFLRVNNVTIGYTLPARLLQRWKIDRIRFYLTSQNLYTFKKYSGFTPEIYSATPTTAGIDLNTYPTSRIIAFGVNVGL